MHEAVRNGLGDMMIDFLLENGAAIDTKDKAGGTALHVAARIGKPEIARVLLAKGAGKTKRRTLSCSLTTQKVGTGANPQEANLLFS